MLLTYILTGYKVCVRTMCSQTCGENNMKSTLPLAVAVISLLLPFSVMSEDMTASQNYMPSLITDTPYEGRQLAIKIVRKTIGTIQTNGDAKHRVRAKYAEDPALLMNAAELVAIEFKTIAIANDYWRK